MTHNEFAKMASAIKTYFPRDNVLPTENAMELWYHELKDLSYDVASTALRMHVATNRFSPTIADIRENATKLSNKEKEDSLNEMAAWQMVLKAMRNSIYHADEEFAKLPPLVQKAVVNPGQLREWAMAEDVDGTWMNVTQSNFMRTYRAEEAMDREMKKMSPDILRLVGMASRQELVDQERDKPAAAKEGQETPGRDTVPMPGRLKERYMALMGLASSVAAQG